MTAGVGLFGAFSAALAAWFLIPENEETDAEIAAMREEVQKLREAVERLATAAANPSPSPTRET